MQTCYFCHLAQTKEDIRIIEDDKFFADWDPAPVSKGHAFVSPKNHIESFFEAKPEEIKNIFEFILKVKKIIEAKYHPDGYNIGINDGRAADRSIDHLHIHIIPRYTGDVENPKGGVRNILGTKVEPKPQPKKF